ncbi:MerR family transcriptional regulator [Mesorhizobium muleiense]|uniref:MerR family transcriptional regulator n=1 Tax=Mesorhizobium muleiense TaxID=1004279 RepID=UPI003AFB3E14
MNSSAQFLNASEAAGRLGVSAKALRLYEQRGLIAPIRTAAGWRAYGPVEMSRAAEIAALRALGFSLAQVARVMEGDSRGMEPALAAHQAVLESRLRQLVGVIEKIGSLRDDLARGEAPSAGELARLLAPRGYAQRRFRPSLALGRRAVRTGTDPTAELHHRPAGQWQDPAGSAPGRDIA